MSLEPEIYPNRTTDVYSAVRNCCTPLKYGFFCAWLYGTQNYLINFCGHLTCNEFYADQRKNVWNTAPPGFVWPNVVKFGISEVRLIVPNLRPLAHIDLDTPRHATGLYLRWHLSHLHTNSFVRCVLWQAVSQWRHTCTCRSKTQCWRKHFDCTWAHLRPPVHNFGAIGRYTTGDNCRQIIFDFVKETKIIMHMSRTIFHVLKAVLPRCLVFCDVTLSLGGWLQKFRNNVIASNYP